MRKNKDARVLDLLGSGSTEQQNAVLEDLYKSNYPRIIILARKYHLSDEDGKDVLQDAMVVLYNQARSKDFELSCSISTYIYSICRNLILKRLRSKNKTSHLDNGAEAIEVDDNVLNVLLGTEKEQAIASAFSKLKPDCQEILRLFYYDSLPLKEIAGQMSLASVQGAKNKKSRCLGKLKRIILSSKTFKNLLAPESNEHE